MGAVMAGDRESVFYSLLRESMRRLGAERSAQSRKRRLLERCALGRLQVNLHGGSHAYPAATSRFDGPSFPNDFRDGLLRIVRALRSSAFGQLAELSANGTNGLRSHRRSHVKDSGRLLPTRGAVALFGSLRGVRNLIPKPVLDVRFLGYSSTEDFDETRWIDRLVSEVNIIETWQQLLANSGTRATTSATFLPEVRDAGEVTGAHRKIRSGIRGKIRDAGEVTGEVGRLLGVMTGELSRQEIQRALGLKHSELLPSCAGFTPCQQPARAPRRRRWPR